MLAAGAGLAMAGPTPGIAFDLACPGADVTVIAEDPALAQRICDMTAETLARFRTCNLEQRNPITITVENRLDPTYPAMLGHYHPGQGKVDLLSPQILPSALRPGSVLASLVPLELFDSLLVHELAHAVINGHAEIPRTLTRDEYIAYAMQLWSLPEATRERWLSAFRFAGPVTLEDLNEGYLMMAPNAFGAKVWTHFSAAGNGCDFVAQVLDGKVAFPSWGP